VQLAVQKGHIDVLQLLRHANAILDIRDNYGNTPALTAACYGNINALQLLCDAKANLNLMSLSRPTFGASPAYLAAVRGHVNFFSCCIMPGLIWIRPTRKDHHQLAAAQEGHLGVCVEAAASCQGQPRNAYKEWRHSSLHSRIKRSRLCTSAVA